MEKKLFLIDGHSLIFRMYYAFLGHSMLNSKGCDVSVLYGFVKWLLELVENRRPTHLAVCFDPPGKTFRHEMYPEYKATRDAAPELVISSLEPLQKICRAMRIPVLMVSGYEGDDVLASAAVRMAGEGFAVYVVTPDKDLGQIVGNGICQLKPGKGGKDDEILGEKEVCEKYGIGKASQVVDMLAICGDASDNVPGVKGVGEKGAAKLISRYGSVESIYTHLDELTPAMAEKFRAAAGHIGLSKTLVTVRTDVPLDVSSADMALAESHSREVYDLFDYYEFPSLKKYLVPGDDAVPANGQDRSVSELKMEEVTSERLCALASACGNCAIAVEAGGEGIFAPIIRINCAVASDGVASVSCGDAEAFREILSDSSVVKTGFDLKLALNLLFNAGIPLEGRLDDLSLMHYLISPEQNHKPGWLCRNYLHTDIDTPLEEADAVSEDLFAQVPDTAPGKPDFRPVAAACLMADRIREDLRAHGAENLYYEMEEPLAKVLAGMERTGVKVNLDDLSSFAAGLREELAGIENSVREKVGDESLNLSSPAQVGVALFGKLRIDPKVKAKTDCRHPYPTDENTLMNYAESHPVIYEILEYRALSKLLNTYIEPFGAWIAPQDGRIHTVFNQALTATGRLSSSRPNLQNIPVRTERGREIRKAFTAAPGKMVMSADYSQIELRLMAHFCGDENMLEAFRSGRDVHSAMAAKIFKVTPDEVTPDMRRKAKTANFGIMYGISPFGLSQRLRIPRVAARKLIEDYFENFPAVRDWIETNRSEASCNGYVSTLLGRRRYLPEINSRNGVTRAVAERNATNAPIQGTAADIIKMAMIRVDKAIRENGLESRMLLQIHDELLFEAPEGEIERLAEIIKREMENVITLSVPLTVECGYGKNWLEAH